MAVKDSDWLLLPIIEAAYISEPVKMSNSQFMIYDQDHHRFMIYNSNTNKWQFLPKGDEESFKEFAYDGKNNTFYGCKDDDGYDMEEQENPRMIIIKRNIDDWECKERQSFSDIDINTTPVCIFANNKFHIIGGWDNKHHIVYDPDKKSIEIVHTFNEWITGRSIASLIHNPSKNKLYLLGGFDEGYGWLDDIWMCDFSNSESEYKWTKMKLKLPSDDSFNFCLTNNHKYIIAGEREQLYYHKLGTDKWIQSEIET